MAGVFVILPFNHVNGTVADANEVMANNAAMRDGHNNSLHGTTGHTHDGTNWNGPKLGAGAIDLNVDFNWTGIHTYLCSKLRVKGAGVGTVGFCYENTGNNRTHTIRAGSGDDYFVLEGAIQTLTNKTLTSPIINTSIDMSAGAVSVSLNAAVGAVNFGANTLVLDGLNGKVAIGTVPSATINPGGLLVISEIASNGADDVPNNIGTGYLNALNAVFCIGAGAAAGGGLIGTRDFNCSSFVRNAVGDYTITFNTANIASELCASACPLNATIASNKQNCIIINSTANIVDVGIIDDGGIAIDSDYSILVIGT